MVLRFRRLVPSSYGRKLNDLVRKQEPAKAVDRLLVAALIEARSCERFRPLRAPGSKTGTRRLLRRPIRFGGPAPLAAYVELAKLFASEYEYH